MRLEPGKTCWTVETGSQVKLLVDAAAYYEDLRRSCTRARHSIYLLGWDIDSRTPLHGERPPDDGLPAQLLPFLTALLERTPSLNVYILAWDFALLYVWERQTLPSYRFAWEGHERLTFRMDDHHPPGASHHQKMVVIDDAVAFCGGIDLTLARWDTNAHLANDPRRTTPDGNTHHPMHDAQLAVSGPAARKLGDLFRERWRCAQDTSLPAPPLGQLALDHAELTDVKVGICRTMCHDESQCITEVEALTVTAIREAKEHIYIENQYLSSAAVGRALQESLSQPQGPEILIVLPKAESGWLEQESMGLLKQRLLAGLRKADVGKRLRVLYPFVRAEDGREVDVYVHSKLVFVDHQFAKVGSSNLSNRSMRLDSECDLAILAYGNGTVSRAIAGWRARLLAEHLGLTVEHVEQGLQEQGMLAFIDTQAKNERGLRPVPETVITDPNFDFSVYDGVFSDPEKPLSAEALLGEAMPEPQRRLVRSTLALYTVVALVILGGLVAAKLGWLSPQVTAAAAWFHAKLEPYLDSLPGWIGLGLATALVTSVFVPLSITMATVCVLTPGWPAFGILFSGALSAALGTYWVGRLFLQELHIPWLQRRTQKLRPRLRHGGFLAVLIARLVPVGSFTLINLVAGALRIPFPAYALANAVGLLPGITLMSLLSGRFAAYWQHANTRNAVVAGLSVCLLLGGFALIGYLVRRQLGARRSRGDVAPVQEGA
ncbi:MAG: VTT domain-containing protein [Deltaproteobacteria bacterium]|nr:VTT domain-containing protein [Deltaproteobacteria bacterium]